MTHPSTSSRASSLLLGSLVSFIAFAFAFACDGDAGVGSPCATNEDCGDELICDIHDGQGTCQQDHGHEGETGESDCEVEIRDDDFSVGLSKAGTLATATFVSADPAPPIRGDNTWVLRFDDSDGAPLDGLEIEVTPTMPDHGHGTPVVAVVTPTGDAGEYSVTPVNMFMAGYWEIAFDLKWGEQQDSLTFGFCVE
jgi:YtkA-like